MNTTINQFNESKLEKIASLKKAINNGSFKCLNTPNTEWGRAQVIITSCKDKIKIYVLTKHSNKLSKLFHYVKENIMDERYFHLYELMALLANDFTEEFGDMNDYTPLLNHITVRIVFYYLFKGKNLLTVTRSLLSYNISDEDIKHIL